MVFYRKYRSQKIDELDSEGVRNALFSVLSVRDSIPHAFLFTGPKGLGKTSAARIIAKAVNCKKNQGKKKLKVLDDSNNIEPCNECEQCISITNGTNMDVLEIDAASNRGIDEIRDLREKIRLSPLSAAKKVYIIDEVHMLTTEAFNALLKTLEEPPSHAMFVLCTTEPHKVPATILSRCFHIQFKLASIEEIVRSLARIVEGEKLQLDDGVLPLIAQRAEGGFRDGAKILEEISLLAKGQKITTELVDGVYKVSSIKKQVLNVAQALVKKDTKEGLDIVQDLVDQGVDMRFFLQQVIEFLHEKLLEQAGVKKGFTAHGSQLTVEIDDIRVLFELFSRAYAEMKTAILPQLPLELVIIEYTTKILKRDAEIEELDKDKKIVVDKGNEVTIAKLRKQYGTITKIKALYGRDTIRRPAEDTSENKIDKPIELMHVPADGKVTAEWLEAFWRGMLAEMRLYNHTVAGVLRSCSIKSYEKKRLVIQTAYVFHKERLDDLKIRQALSKACKMLTGNDAEIEVQLKGK